VPCLAIGCLPDPSTPRILSRFAKATKLAESRGGYQEEPIRGMMILSVVVETEMSTGQKREEEIRVA